MSIKVTRAVLPTPVRLTVSVWFGPDRYESVTDIVPELADENCIGYEASKAAKVCTRNAAIKAVKEQYPDLPERLQGLACRITSAGFSFTEIPTDEEKLEASRLAQQPWFRIKVWGWWIIQHAWLQCHHRLDRFHRWWLIQQPSGKPYSVAVKRPLRWNPPA